MSYTSRFVAAWPRRASAPHSSEVETSKWTRAISARAGCEANAAEEQAVRRSSSASFEREGQVYTEIVPDARKRTLQAVIRGRVGLEKAIHSDGWRGYDGLVDVGYRKHFRVRHREDCFANGKTHINGIEAFWSFAKRRLAKFCGVPKHTFWLHLKECEWRFNHRDVDLYQTLLKLLRERPL